MIVSSSRRPANSVHRRLGKMAIVGIADRWPVSSSQCAPCIMSEDSARSSNSSNRACAAGPSRSGAGAIQDRRPAGRGRREAVHHVGGRGEQARRELQQLLVPAHRQEWRPERGRLPTRDCADAHAVGVAAAPERVCEHRGARPGGITAEQSVGPEQPGDPPRRRWQAIHPRTAIWASPRGTPAAVAAVGHGSHLLHGCGSDATDHAP